MDELKELVKNLEEENDEEKQITLLQQIESKLLNEYNIVIEDTIIEPLRLEAYYYPFENKGKFDDPCAHKCTKKINNFGKLYFIEERYGYPGIDICLSLGNYYLSFFIYESVASTTSIPILKNIPKYSLENELPISIILLHLIFLA